MAGSGENAPPERPLLAGGERLAREAQPARAPGEKYHPQSLAEARIRFGPAAREIRQRAQTMPRHLRGERVILEATLLPNYLAASYHPRRLRDDADLIALGTRTATGTLRTAREQKENQPTKTLLLAATERSLHRLEALLGDEDAAAEENVLADLTKLQELCLPDRGPRPAPTPAGAARSGRGERRWASETWEAVLHPAIDAAGNISQSALELSSVAGGRSSKTTAARCTTATSAPSDSSRSCRSAPRRRRCTRSPSSIPCACCARCRHARHPLRPALGRGQPPRSFNPPAPEQPRGAHRGL